jgi:putative oxidoreductase
MSTSNTLPMSSPGVTTNSLHDITALVGRILIAYLFIPAGFGKLMGFAGTVGYINSVGLPLPEVGAAIAIVVELGFGIALLLGYKTRFTAFVMAAFTIAAALFFHKYWSAPDAMKMMQTINFNKNIAIAGGLIALAGFGAGRLSIDGKQR